MNFRQPLAWTLTALALAACAGNTTKQAEPDYQSASQKVVPLDVPPDLTNPDQGNQYALPADGAVRASDLNAAKQNAQKPAGDKQVLTKVANVHLESEGSMRWLNVTDKEPAELWPLLRAFWQEQGFTIAREEPSIGLMQTDWAENRAKLPGSTLRNLFEKVGLGGIYSTGERDMFTIRLERNANGKGTNVFFAQKGMEEVYTNKAEDTTAWQPRANDPMLEATFLARFMQYLGADEQQIRQEAAQGSKNTSDLAKLDGGTLLVRGDQDRNWRRIALALDRIGLTVIGENTARHAFLVEVAPAESEAVRDQKPGLLARWFGSSKEQPKTEQPRFVVVAEPSAQGTQVRLANQDGSAYQGSDAKTWLTQLYNQLR